MNVIFIIVYAIWLSSEIILNRLLRAKASDKNADKNSLSLIWIAISISIPLSILISHWLYLPLIKNSIIKYYGLIIIVVGILLRLYAIISLGRFFTVGVAIRQNHRLKKDGIYKYLRHPSYFASLSSFIGFGVSLNNWLSLLFITIAILIVFTIRIKIEEKALIGQFGEEYLNYRKATSGIIPFIY